VNCCEPDGSKSADVGERVKTNTLTAALAFKDGSDVLIAVTVWLPVAAGAA
jgi:hypothetical protein